MSVTVDRIANKLATFYVDTAKPAGDRDMNIRIATYNAKVIAFNVATVAAVAMVALAIVTVLSFQAALVLGGLFLIVRYFVGNDLNQIQLPRTFSDSQKLLARLALGAQPGNPEVHARMQASNVCGFLQIADRPGFRVNALEFSGISLIKRPLSFEPTAADLAGAVDDESHPGGKKSAHRESVARGAPPSNISGDNIEVVERSQHADDTDSDEEDNAFVNLAYRAHSPVEA